jgi:hypothetical protein
VSLFSFLRAKEKVYLIGNGILALITGLISIQSRSEASPYIILSTVIVIFLNYNLRELKVFNKKFIIPILVLILATYEFLTTPSTLGWSTGLPGGDQNRSSGELWFRNISDWPTFITGSLGGWPLGWLDVPLPSIIYFCAMFTFVGILFTGFLNLNWKKSIALVIIVSALIILPLRILALGKNYVGEMFNLAISFPYFFS